MRSYCQRKEAGPWKKQAEEKTFSHGRTRNFTEKDRNRDTEKTARRKGILATEGHGISLDKTEAETRKRQTEEKAF